MESTVANDPVRLGIPETRLDEAEKLDEAVCKFVKENGCVKGKKNMVCSVFCQYVLTKYRFAIRVLKPGCPRRISINTYTILVLMLQRRKRAYM